MIVSSIDNIYENKNFNSFMISDDTKNILKKDIVYFTNKHGLSNNIILPQTESPNADLHDTYFKIDESIFNTFNNKVDLRNDRPKVLILRSFTGFGHFIIDFIGIILESLANIDNPVFVFNINDFNKVDGKKYFDFLKECLNVLNVEYIFVEGEFAIAVSNFYHIYWVLRSDRLYNNTYKMSERFLENKKLESPTKKVYIRSKNNMNNVDFKNLTVSQMITSRIINEKILEQYLESNGFEILSPNSRFQTIKEQTEYFKNVKTLFAVTCSGLVNSLFMQPKGTIIELMSPFEAGPEDFSFFWFHSNQYQDMAYSKNHTYFAKKNLIDAKLIVEDIKNDPKFLEMLK